MAVRGCSGFGNLGGELVGRGGGALGGVCCCGGGDDGPRWVRIEIQSWDQKVLLVSYGFE